MRTLLLFLLIVFFAKLHSQNVVEVNRAFNIPDSLSHKTEIRIYQGGGITNYDSLFRMYKDNTNTWIAEFYEHWAKVDGVEEKKTSRKNISAKNGMEYVYLNFLRSHINHIPDRKEIGWKLASRGEIKKFERFRKGKKFEEWDILTKQTMPLDGTGYYFQVKSLNTSNSFSFSNPERYNQLYPKVDEPAYVCELINIVRKEFEIWNK